MPLGTIEMTIAFSILNATKQENRLRNITFLVQLSIP